MVNKIRASNPSGLNKGHGSKFNKKHLEKARGYISWNIVNITIKMKTIVWKPWIIKIKLHLKNSDNWSNSVNSSDSSQKFSLKFFFFFFFFFFFSEIIQFNHKIFYPIAVFDLIRQFFSKIYYSINEKKINLVSRLFLKSAFTVNFQSKTSWKKCLPLIRNYILLKLLLDHLTFFFLVK